MTDTKIKIGIITSAHGVAGEMKVKALTDFPQRFKKTPAVFIDSVCYKIVAASVTKTQIIIKLDNITDRNAAEKMRGKYLEIPSNETVKLPDDSYYVWQITGCSVYENGKKLGILSNVLSTGSNDVYVVDGEDGQILVPALKQVVRKIDIKNKRIDIKQLPEL